MLNNQQIKEFIEFAKSTYPLIKSYFKVVYLSGMINAKSGLRGFDPLL